MSIQAIRIHETGGPDVLRLDTVDLADPGPGQIRVRHTAIGVNFIDTYHRSGLYPLPLPSGIGLEAAGIVEAVGDGVTTLQEGDRVAYGSGPIGAYSQAHILPAGRVAKIPDGVSDEQAAALLLKGMTVRYLFKDTYALQAGDTILFHAAAGGVGQIACQWAADMGVTLIGTAGSDEKCEIARQKGAAHTINYSRENVVERVREITEGRGVPVVYDGVGKDTFEMSLDCLAPRGLLVTFGNASGPVTGVNLGILTQKGSLYVTRPSLMHYVASDDDLAANTADVFDAVARGAISIAINQRYALADAQKAHEDLEGRRTTGASVLVP
ncbi:quinone oxidoreductase [Maricaulis sp.]|uniref:quinone oxidoreductase family protein n=1 Tax=Maricaulis sp. TaxID=1486257 RepID=UPI001B22EF55|nr:quinone oxidoreductase [Maricaulis sp.]MBO6763418.1 quinone oxidoreductase [Maricaulis sp.]